MQKLLSMSKHSDSSWQQGVWATFACTRSGAHLPRYADLERNDQGVRQVGAWQVGEPVGLPAPPGIDRLLRAGAVRHAFLDFQAAGPELVAVAADCRGQVQAVRHCPRLLPHFETAQSRTFVLVG